MIIIGCLYSATVQLCKFHVQQHIHLMYMHCMDGTDLNIAQLTVILMNSLVITENVNLKAMSVMGLMTVEIIVMKKDVVCDLNCIHDLSM